MKALTPFPGKFPSRRRRPRRGTLARQQAWQHREDQAFAQRYDEACERLARTGEEIDAITGWLDPDSGDAA